MPNWCTCKMKVTGSKSQINKMLTAIKGEHKEKDGTVTVLPFDFEKIIPTPADLIDEQSPPISKEKGYSNMKQYGAKDWYSFRVENWGTKWNLGEETYIDFKGDVCNMEFQTAWSPPFGILEKLSTMFPKLNFEIAYIDEGMGFVGVCNFKDGEKEDNCIGPDNETEFNRMMEERFPEIAQEIEEMKEEDE